MVTGEQTHRTALAGALTDLHLQAGRPSTRTVARMTGQLSHDTVHRMLTEDRLPLWRSLELVVTALGGDVEAFRRLWLVAATGDEADFSTEAESGSSPRRPAGSMAAPIRVFVVDPHALFRVGVMGLLRDAGFDVVGEAGSSAEALERAPVVRPDVVLMDILMPALDGIEVTRRLGTEVPAARVLMLTMSAASDDVVASLQAGAVGYLAKDTTPPEELVKAIHAVVRGDAVFSAGLTDDLLSRVQSGPHVESRHLSRDALGLLTVREREILALVAEGLSNRQIAAVMSISKKTVNTHLSNISAKLGVTSRVEMARTVLEQDTARDKSRFDTDLAPASVDTDQQAAPTRVIHRSRPQLLDQEREPSHLRQWAPVSASGTPVTPKPTRVLLAQDRTLIRGALAAFLGQEADLHVVAEVAELGEVVTAARRCRTDLVILDLDLIDIDHLSTLAALTRALPGVSLLVLTDIKQSAMLASAPARELPRVGFVSKQARPTRLVEAVRTLAKGEPPVDPQLAIATLTARGNPLTAREREVLVLAAAGAPAREIAARLFLATGTVRNYLSSSMGKTGARTRNEAIRIAQEAGWL